MIQAQKSFLADLHRLRSRITDEIKFEVVSSCENILKEVDKFITMIERLK